MILDIPDRVWGGWSMACSKANPAGVAGGMRCFEAYDWRRTDLRRGPLRHLGNDAALAAPTVARQPPELLEDARGLPVRRLFASACASSSAIIATSRSFRAKPSRKCTPLSLSQDQIDHDRIDPTCGAVPAPASRRVHWRHNGTGASMILLAAHENQFKN
jgi:hypothetical protein